MSEPLAPADFRNLTEPLVLEVEAAGSHAAVELSVQSIRELPAHRFRPEPFSLMLRGPASPAVPQGTYWVDHPVLGAMELFLVPISGDATSRVYEVTFN